MTTVAPALTPSTSMLLVVDVQEKLFPAMPEETRERMKKNVEILMKSAARLQVPMLVTEQYPRGLGPSLEVVSRFAAEHNVPVVEKMTFSAFGEAHVVIPSGIRSVVVVGMESHICVLHTVRDLVAKGLSVHVVADAVSSRREESRAIALTHCTTLGALITTTETVLFGWLGRAGTDEFRELSKLIR